MTRPSVPSPGAEGADPSPGSASSVSLVSVPFQGGAKSAKTLPRPSMPPEPAQLAAAALRPLRRLPTVAAGCQRENSAREEAPCTWPKRERGRLGGAHVWRGALLVSRTPRREARSPVDGDQPGSGVLHRRVR
jgi:hypothetical protein